MKRSFDYLNASSFRRLLALAVMTTAVAVSFTGCFGKGDPEETVPPTEPPLMIQTDPTEAPAEPETTAPADKESNIVIDGKTATITGAPVDIYSKVGAEGKVIGSLEVGTQAEILRQVEVDGIKWALVREGWIITNNVSLDSIIPEEDDDLSVVPEEDKDDPEPPRREDNSITNPTKKVGVVTARGLNVRSEPTTDSKVVDYLKRGANVTILEQKGGWGRIHQGWISLDFVSFDGNAGNTQNNNNNNQNVKPSGNVIAKGVVTTDGLNIRSGAGTNHNAVGSYNYGDRVEFYEKTTVGDATWGKTAKGWVALSYVYMDGTRSNDSGNGKITGDVLNVRSGPGTGYKVVGSLKQGDHVEILAKFKIDGKNWGCISNGWIAMDYVDMMD